MKKFVRNILKITLVIVVAALGFTSCNKDLPGPTAILFPKNGDTTLFGALGRDTTLSFYKAAVVKAGLTNLFNDNTTIFTAFVPNNSAFILSGIPSIAYLNGLPTSLVAQIVSYSIIPGEQFIDTLTPATTAFPNVQLPSYLTVGSIPGTAIPINLSIFPSKRPTGFWANNIPVIASNKRVQNGIIHIVAAVVNPAGGDIWDNLVNTDPNFTLLKTVILRADSGQTPGTFNSLQYVLTYPLTNVTLFAPNNAAVRSYINAASGGLIPIASPDAVFMAFINNPAFVTAQAARGLTVYHLMPYRAFSVNFPTTPPGLPPYFPTLLNQVIPTHPGLKVQATIVGGFGAALAVTGLFNAGPSIVTGTSNLDRNFGNGVVHVVDQVMKPAP